MDVRKEKLTLLSQRNLHDALNAINEVPIGIVMVVDEDRKLLGVATDGDIRRALLDGKPLDAPIEEVMTDNPATIAEGYSKNQALRRFTHQIKHIPVLDADRKVVDLLVYQEFCKLQNEIVESEVRCKAPFRISFAGGGTDVNPYIEQNGGLVLSSTIDKYCYGSLKKRDDNKIVVRSEDYDLLLEADNLKALKYDGRLDLVKAVLKLMEPSFGLELNLRSDVSVGSGLGGSATVACVTAGLLNHLRKDKLDEYQIAEIAFQAERIELGINGGWQDQYAAVFGGFNFIEFKVKDVVVHPLRINEDVVNELECCLVLCDTGQTRSSGKIMERHLDAFVSKDKVVTDALHRTRAYALEMKDALLRGELARFGRCLNNAWLEKRKFGTKISNAAVAELYAAGMEGGALAGKVLGAGGGGHMLFFCPPSKKQMVEAKLESMNTKILRFNFGFKGMRSWAVRENYH